MIDPVHENIGHDDHLGHMPIQTPLPKFNVFDSYPKFLGYDHIYVREKDLPSYPTPVPELEDLDNLSDYDACDDAASDSIGPSGYEGPDSYDAFNMPVNACLPLIHGQEPILPPDPVPSATRAQRVSGTTDVTEHQLVLLYPEAPAFCLNTKKWRKHPSAA